MTTCAWCETEHDERYLCDPVKEMLDAMARRGESLTMPTMEFTEAMPVMPAELGDVFMRQLTVQAGIADVGGVTRPVIILSGRGFDGKPLPRWTYVCSVADMQRTRDLFNRMCSIAISRARAGR